MKTKHNKSKTTSKSTKKQIVTASGTSSGKHEERHNSFWWQQMSQGKKVFLSAGGDSDEDRTEQSAMEFLKANEFFQTALKTEIENVEGKKERFRFGRLLISARYLQKSTAQAQLSVQESCFKEASSTVDLIFKAYQFALARCSAKHKPILIASAFEYIVELTEYIAQICQKIEAMDLLAFRYCELLNTTSEDKFWKNSQKKQITRQLGLTRSDYEALSNRAFDVIAKNKTLLDSPIIYSVFTRVAIDLQRKGCVQEAFDLCLKCENTINSAPIPDPLSESKLEFLSLFAQIAELAEDHIKEFALRREFLEEMLLVHPIVVHAVPSTCNCRRTLTDSYMCVESYCEEMVRCLDRLDSRDPIFTKVIEKLFSLIQENKKEGCNEQKQKELSKALFKLIRKRLYCLDDPDFHLQWLENARQLLLSSNEPEHQTAGNEAELYAIEALSCMKNGDYERMAILFESAIEKSVQASRIDFHMLAKIHLSYSVCIHKVPGEHEPTKMANAAKQILNGLAYASILRDSELVNLAETATVQFVARYQDSPFRRTMEEKLESARLALAE